ncbi:techylectin-5A-like [Argiope bruennichi]|uniref:techylectin-5A-like n=1 Tax=Argiope bruennichi TaxID=94029 RepID=UPI002494F87C|nr:techylectin-5A-like [Argiope bruennichi]
MWNAKITFGVVVCVILTSIQTEADSSAFETDADSLSCEQKEKHFVVLDLAKELISKAKTLHPSCVNDCKDNSSTANKCGVKEKVSAYLNIAMKLVEEAKESYTTCDASKNCTKVVFLHKKPIDCSEILENGERKSGVYKIWPRHRIFEGKPLSVYCDMETDGGGWTVIQRRGNFSNKIDFYRNWHDYKYGFGNITEEFWIGNENIYALTNQGNYFMRFDIETVNRERSFAIYSSFWVENESADYMLHFGNYSGTAGDGISTLRGMKFSTKDKRNDIWTDACTTVKQGGWWYSACGGSNPNGINLPEGKNDGKYMNWEPVTKYDSLLAIAIKIRPYY